MKIKIPGKKKKVTTIASGTVNPIHKVPGRGTEDGEEINLSHLNGWDDLTIQKQRYLVSFSKNNLKKTRAALAIGISGSEVDDWAESDAVFASIFNMIIDIHVEGVEEVDYLASYGNTSSRGRFLSKRSKIYKEEPDESKPQIPQIGTQNNQTNIFALLNSPEATNKGLAGVQKVFNELKQTGKLPESVNEKGTD